MKTWIIFLLFLATGQALVTTTEQLTTEEQVTESETCSSASGQCDSVTEQQQTEQQQTEQQPPTDTIDQQLNEEEEKINQAERRLQEIKEKLEEKKLEEKRKDDLELSRELKEYSPQTLKEDPFDFLRGYKSREIHLKSAVRDGELFAGREKTPEPNDQKSRPKMKIIGLKTILLKYFIMPIKKTLTFLFEDSAEHDSHYVMKKNDENKDINSNKLEKVYDCKQGNKTATTPLKYIPENELLSEMNSSVGCGAVLFYKPNCRFSIELLPVYKALSRIYPQLTLFAVHINSYSSSCLQFGAVGTPTVMFYHNSRPIKKMPAYVNNITLAVQYISNITDLSPEANTTLLPEDSEGVELVQDFDWALLFSVLFLSTSVFYNFIHTPTFRLFLGRLVTGLFSAFKRIRFGRRVRAD